MRKFFVFRKKYQTGVSQGKAGKGPYFSSLFRAPFPYQKILLRSRKWERWGKVKIKEKDAEKDIGKIEWENKGQQDGNLLRRKEDSGKHQAAVFNFR